MAKDIKNKSKNTPNANSDNLHEDQEKNDRQLFFDESHKETIQIQTRLNQAQVQQELLVKRPEQCLN